MTATPAVKTAAKTVYRNNSDTHYTKLDNETLRCRIPGDKLNAKDVWLYALTCQPDWLMTTKNLSRRFGVSTRVMGELLTRLATAGYAHSLKTIDSKSGRIVRHQWVFCERPILPQHENGGCGQNDENPHKQREKQPDTHTPENGGVGSYIDQDNKNKQHSEKTTPAPPPEPPPEKQPEPQEKQTAKKAPGGAVVDLSKIKNLVDPVIYNAIGKKTMIAICAGKSLDTVKYASKKAMASPLKGKTGLFINTLNDPPPEALPCNDKIIDINSNMPDAQRCALKCYNKNVSKIEKSCPSMMGSHTPTGNCVLYCPYAIRITKG